MPKLKLRKGTKYPFKHLDKIGAKFTTTEPKKNVSASLAMYKKKNDGFKASVLEYESGIIVVTRVA